MSCNSAHVLADGDISNYDKTTTTVSEPRHGDADARECQTTTAVARGLGTTAFQNSERELNLKGPLVRPLVSVCVDTTLHQNVWLETRLVKQPKGKRQKRSTFCGTLFSKIFAHKTSRKTDHNDWSRSLVFTNAAFASQFARQTTQRSGQRSRFPTFFVKR